LNREGIGKFKRLVRDNERKSLPLQQQRDADSEEKNLVCQALIEGAAVV